jgi:hypothetical protein
VNGSCDLLPFDTLNFRKLWGSAGPDRAKAGCHRRKMIETVIIAPIAQIDHNRRNEFHVERRGVGFVSCAGVSRVRRESFSGQFRAGRGLMGV